jgi:hypothetical protein
MTSVGFPFLAILLLAAAPPHITSIQGQVSVRHGGDDAWAGAPLNSPLLPDDRIRTGARSTVGIEVASTNRLQIAANTEVRLARSEDGRYRVETPSVAVRPYNSGVYRIAINRAGESEIVVSKGNVEVAGPGGSQWIYAGQTLLARGPATDPEFRVIKTISRWKRVALIVASMVQFGDVISSVDVGAGAKSSPAPRSSPPPRSDTARAGR